MPGPLGHRVLRERKAIDQPDVVNGCVLCPEASDQLVSDRLVCSDPWNDQTAEPDRSSNVTSFLTRSSVRHRSVVVGDEPLWVTTAALSSAVDHRVDVPGHLGEEPRFFQHFHLAFGDVDVVVEPPVTVGTGLEPRCSHDVHPAVAVLA